jgi:hydroxymethylpyrimidine/phosphomethylpyrimidine kinase
MAFSLKGNRASWQWPTLPGGYPPSTISAGELNYRVRDGTGCTLAALITNWLCLSSLLSQASCVAPHKRQILRTSP